MQGLIYLEDPFDLELTIDLEEFVRTEKFLKKTFHVNPSNPNSRVVAHYGFKYDYKNGNTLEKTHKFPKLLKKLRKKIMKLHEFDDETTFNQCIMNRYLPGQGIGAHIDKLEYGKEIACVSILGGTDIIFSKGDLKETKYIKPNSLYIMTDESRYEWKHEMTCRKTDAGHGARQTRWSLTFRTVPL